MKGATRFVASRVRKGRRPSPRIAQLKRTWYFFRRNSLAMVGLSILLLIGAVAVYGLFQSYSWTEMQTWCATDFGGPGTVGPNGAFNPNSLACKTSYVCNYESTLPTNYQDFCGGTWYKEPTNGQDYFAGAIAPTLSLAPLQSGPMPLGSLAHSIQTSNPLYNLYSGMVRGSDWSLIFAVSIVGAGALIGLIVGSIAGLWGGLVDEFLMRLVDIFLSIPQILFVIVTISVLLVLIANNPALGNAYSALAMLIVGFVLVWWPFYARIVRGQVLVVREQKYIEAARASGAGKGRILFKHVIPNSMYPVFIQFSLDVGQVPLLLGALVFLGFHIYPAIFFPEWGAISANGVTDMSSYLSACQVSSCIIPWWQIFVPGLALFLFAISVNLLSDGLRDALDPRLRR